MNESIHWGNPIIKAAYELILEFRCMIKNGDGKTLKDWFGKAEQVGSANW
jgi:hypothetical protein